MNRAAARRQHGGPGKVRVPVLPTLRVPATLKPELPSPIHCLHRARQWRIMRTRMPAQGPPARAKTLPTLPPTPTVTNASNAMETGKSRNLLLRRALLRSLAFHGRTGNQDPLAEKAFVT